MNIISTTAKANIKQNKSRNILIAVAIILTTILLTTVPIVGLGAYLPRMAAANKVLPTFHTMFRNVNQVNADDMMKNKMLEKSGTRIDVGQMIAEDATIIMSAYSKEGIALNRLELQEGKVPASEDEIVVSEGLLKAMGLSAEIGDRIQVPYQLYEDGGMGLQKDKEFTISGMIKDAQPNERKMYGALVSEAFAKQEIPNGERAYRVYLRVADSEKLTTDAIRNTAKTIGESYEVSEDNIVHNAEYLVANYIDPALYAGIGVIILIVALAAVMTIYSIYYVSMMNKIQEYGKLKAMGATKKQIKSIVFREGFMVACVAIPIGVILGCALGYGITYRTVMGYDGSDFLTKAMQEVVKNKEVSVIPSWVVVMALVVAFGTVYFSLLKPMKIASKISAIEAIRCHSTQKERKKRRKGYQEINLTKLTSSNLSRNKRRTMITILTLGIISVLFMTIATVLNCLNPEDRARNEIWSDYEVSIAYSFGDKMNPDKELNIMQMDNPLGAAMEGRIAAIDGVQKVEKKLETFATVDGMEMEGRPFEANVTGIGPQNIEELQKHLVEGEIDPAKLTDGSGVIIGGDYMKEMYDVKVGDTYTVHLRDGKNKVAHTFTVMAITDAFRSLYGSGEFVMAAEALQRLCETDLTQSLDITVKKGSEKEVDNVLKSMVESDSRIGMDSFAKRLKEAKMAVDMMVNMGYAFLTVLGIVGILNLVNTMINSVYVRKKELGVLQAIGLSDKQMIQMLQMEGLFYTAGTLIMGLGLGNLFGYFCFLYAKATHMMDIKIYRYPVLPTIALTVAILVTQVLITYLVNKNFKKETLIERVRFAE